MNVSTKEKSISHQHINAYPSPKSVLRNCDTIDRSSSLFKKPNYDANTAHNRITEAYNM